MDVAGARALAQRLKDIHGVEMSALCPAPLRDPGAQPVFRWLGIEPPRPLDPSEVSEGLGRTSQND
jgi:hypothetical protein